MKNNLESWRDLVGYVGQEVNLIEGSLKENIGLGIEEDKIDEKISEVIKPSTITRFY